MRKSGLRLRTLLGLCPHTAFPQFIVIGLSLASCASRPDTVPEFTSVDGFLMIPATAVEGPRNTEQEFNQYWTVLERAEPTYPVLPMAFGQPGCALLEFTVETDGAVTEVHLLREFPAASGFGVAAMEAMKTFQYGPTPINAARAPKSTSLIFVFVLRDPTIDTDALKQKCYEPVSAQ